MVTKMKISMLLLVFCISTFGVNSSLAQTNTKTAKIRSRVNKYGVGKKVAVTLNDGVKYKGRIKQISLDSFSIKDRKKGETKTFTYTEVKKIKKSSYAKWIIIGVAAGVALAVIIPLSMRCRNEGSNTLCL